MTEKRWYIMVQAAEAESKYVVALTEQEAEIVRRCFNERECVSGNLWSNCLLFKNSFATRNEAIAARLDELEL